MEKELSSFNRDKYSKDGHCYICSNCQKVKYHNNKVNKLARQKQRYKENSENIIKRQKEYNSKNKIKRSKYRKSYYLINKQIALSYWSKRRAAKLKATPTWLSKDQLDEIKDLYIICSMFKIYTGIEYHVDHIIPLQGKNVCGLHVPWNLQILTESENKKKSRNIFD